MMADLSKWVRRRLRAAELRRRGVEPTSRTALEEALSYAYVAVWIYTYWIRNTFVGPVIRWALVILSLIELTGPWWDFLYFPTERWWRLGLAGMLFVTACTLSLNHWRLTARLRRHDVILSSIRLLLEEGVLDDGDHASPQDPIIKVLTALVRSIEYARKNVQMDATLMVRSATDGKFRIMAQDSHRAFDPDVVSLDKSDSVAARVAAAPSEVVIYVPNTRFVHGVEINLLKKFPKKEYFRATNIVAEAFEWLDATNQSLVRSLVCTRIPVKKPGVDAVLCVSGRRTNAFWYLELSAIKVAAGLVAQVLKTPGASFATGA